MTVKVIAPYSVHIASGSTTDFPFGYYAYHSSWVVVIQDGVVITPEIILNADQENNTGGIIRITPMPANGAQIISYRDTPRAQTADYPEFGTFPAESHERALDTITLMMQDLNFLTGGSIRVQPQEVNQFLGLLPVVEGRRNRLLAFDDAGQVVVLKPEDLDQFLTSDGIKHDETTVGAELRKHTGEIANNVQGINVNAANVQTLYATTADHTSRLEVIEPLLAITTIAAVALTVRTDEIEENKADKTIEIISGDTNTMTIGAPNLDSDVTISPRVNLPLGLLKLDNDSKIRPSQMPYTGIQNQGIFVTNVDLSNPSERYPTVTFQSGDQFVVLDAGSINVIDANTQLPAVQVVTAGDFLLYTLNSVVNADGWYWYPHASAATLASDITFDPSSSVYVGTNMQAVAEEQSAGHLWRNRAESVNTSFLVGTTMTVNGLQTNNSGIKFGTDGASTAGIVDENGNIMLRETGGVVGVGNPTQDIVISSLTVAKGDVASGGNQPFLIEVYNPATPQSVGADPAGTADAAVAAHKIEATAHTPTVVGADPAGTASTAVSTHNTATTVHSVASVDGLTDALANKYDKTGGTVSGSIRVEGTAVATDDVVGFEGT
jgi:hypothetical protein